MTMWVTTEQKVRMMIEVDAVSENESKGSGEDQR